MNYNTHHKHNESYTKQYQNHTPTGFQLTVVDANENSVDNVIDRGEDCMTVFCKKLGEIDK